MPDGQPTTGVLFLSVDRLPDGLPSLNFFNVQCLHAGRPAYREFFQRPLIACRTAWRVRRMSDARPAMLLTCRTACPPPIFSTSLDRMPDGLACRVRPTANSGFFAPLFLIYSLSLPFNFIIPTATPRPRPRPRP